MKQLHYWFRRHWIELVGYSVGLGTAIAGYIFFKDPSRLFLSSAALVLILAVTELVGRSRQKTFYYLALNHPSYKTDWFGRGVFEYWRTERAYRVTQSEVGFIFSKTLNWSDYRLHWAFRLSNKCCGTIVRAINSFNLVMVQIGVNGIAPHVRVNGTWIRWEPGDVDMFFSKPLDSKQWYEATIICEKDTLTVEIRDKDEILLHKDWILPLVEIPQTAHTGGGTVTTGSHKASFDYGSFGFRCSHDEMSYVKDLLIEKL